MLCRMPYSLDLYSKISTIYICNTILYLHTYDTSLSLSLSLTHTHTHTLSLSLSVIPYKTNHVDCLVRVKKICWFSSIWERGVYECMRIFVASYWRGRSLTRSHPSRSLSISPAPLFLPPSPSDFPPLLCHAHPGSCCETFSQTG